MELPEHTCINCAYLFQSGIGTISRIRREQALIDKNNRWNNYWINYQKSACYKGNQYFSGFNTNNMVIEIHNGIIEPNSCKDWRFFQDISPQDMEQRTSNELAKKSIVVAKKFLGIAFIGMLLTFTVTMITWYLD